MLGAVLNAKRGLSNVVFLTFLGGGAFGNEDNSIHAAIRYALKLVANIGLDVRFVSVGRSCRSFWGWRQSASAFVCCRGGGASMRDGPDEVLLALVLVFAPLSLLALGGGTAVIADIAQQSIGCITGPASASFPISSRCRGRRLAQDRCWPR